MNAQEPYIVTDIGMDLMKLDAACLNVIKVWKSGFDTAAPVVKRGRSQWSLLDDHGTLHACLAKFAPKGIDKIGSDDKKLSATYEKRLKGVHVFGYAADMKHSGGEVHSLASLRLTEVGCRKVVIASISDVMALLKTEALEGEPK
jgi:hypothetical protein